MESNRKRDKAPTNAKYAKYLSFHRQKLDRKSKRRQKKHLQRRQAGNYHMKLLANSDVKKLAYELF